MVKKILLVDDDPDFTDACRNLLEAEGFTVEAEASDKAVIAKMREFGPDLVFLDVLMQDEQSGFSIAAEAAGDGDLKKIPVVFLTGYFKRIGGMEKEDVMDKYPNVKGVIDKPVRPTALLEIVRKLHQSKGG